MILSLHIFYRAERLAQLGIRAAVIYHLCCFFGYVVRTCLYHKAARTTASEAFLLSHASDIMFVKLLWELRLVEEIYYDSVSSPIGRIWIASGRVGVRLLRFRMREEEFLQELQALGGRHPRAAQEYNRGVAEEIRAYFEGEVTRFSSPLHPVGSPFDLRVWEVLKHIPLGETRSYEEIAQEVGNPRGCRAIGGANRRNPIPLLIPCHRVIRKDGGLGGFSSGTEIKEWLLRFEQKVIHNH